MSWRPSKAWPGGLACLSLLLIHAGCAGYRLGPTQGTAAGARAVHVEPFRNDTVQPRLEDSATQELRRRLQRDGTFRLAGRDACDVVVSGVVKQYSRLGLSYDPTDVITVRDYSLAMTVRLQARERATGKVLLDQDVVGYTPVRAGADFSSAERQATPMLTQDFARRATDLLVDGTW